MEDIRTEYSETLKEIVRLESKITRLKAKAAQLENKLLFEDAPSLDLDKDGCIYWDNILEKTKHKD